MPESNGRPHTRHNLRDDKISTARHWPRSLDAIYSDDVLQYVLCMPSDGEAICYLMNEKNNEQSNKNEVMGSSLIQQKR